MKRRHQFGATRGETIFVYSVMALVMAAMLLPFVHEIAKSFSHPTAVEAGRVILAPVGFTFGNYRYYGKAEYAPLLRAFVNNVLITAIGTSWSVLFTALTAFPVSRPKRDFLLGPFIMSVVVASIVFAPPMIPYFLAIRTYGLMDSWGALILTHTVLSFNMILTVSYFRGLPEELFEACRIDGGGDWRQTFAIALPLSKPILATIGVYTAVLFWNMYLHPLLFIRSQGLQPLQPFVRSILADSAETAGAVLKFDVFSNAQSTKSALILLTTAPIVAVYPFLQKHFVKGSLSGALKA